MSLVRWAIAGSNMIVGMKFVMKKQSIVRNDERMSGGDYEET
jgi:hypothetical protein